MNEQREMIFFFDMLNIIHTYFFFLFFIFHHMDSVNVMKALSCFIIPGSM